MLLSFLLLDVNFNIVPTIPNGNDRPMIAADPRQPKSSQFNALPTPIANIPSDMPPKISPPVDNAVALRDS